MGSYDLLVGFTMSDFDCIASSTIDVGGIDVVPTGVELTVCVTSNGFGTGSLNAVVPVYATETAEHTSRGQVSWQAGPRVIL